MVVQLAELLGIHSQFSGHLDLSVRQTMPLPSVNPCLHFLVRLFRHRACLVGPNLFNPKSRLNWMSFLTGILQLSATVFTTSHEIEVVALDLPAFASFKRQTNGKVFVFC